MVVGDGLLCSDLNVDTMRPWTVDELSKAKAEIWSNWRHDPAGCMAYEDALMATGRYIRVKVLHDPIAPGTPPIQHQAEGAVEAILAVAQAGERVEPGYLPKPFGDLKRAAESKGISYDQIEHVALGLWQFRKQYPDSTLNAEREKGDYTPIPLDLTPIPIHPSPVKSKSIDSKLLLFV